MTERYDVYVGQARSNGRLDTLKKHTHRVFDYWIFEYVQTYWREYEQEAPKDIKGILVQVFPTSKWQGQEARQRFIKKQEAEGLTVKGVSYINMVLVNDLNRERFNTSSEPVKTVDEFKKLWDAGEFLSVRDHVYGPKEYEQLPLFDLKEAMDDDLVYQAFPKEELRDQDGN